MTSTSYEKTAIEIAESILNNEVDFLRGVREMVALQATLPPEQQPYFDLFRAIESETDHLVLNDLKIQLSPNRARRNEDEIKDYERFFRSQVEELCRQIIKDRHF